PEQPYEPRKALKLCLRTRSVTLLTKGLKPMMNTKKRVLIIDDEASFTRLLKLNLHHTGKYCAETVNDPVQALAVAREFRPDVILLNVIMHGMDGGGRDVRLQSRPRP